MAIRYKMVRVVNPTFDPRERVIRREDDQEPDEEAQKRAKARAKRLARGET